MASVWVDKRYTTAVEFSQDNELKTWLPQQITIRVFGKGHMEQQVVINYSGFRVPAPADRADKAPPTKP